MTASSLKSDGAAGRGRWNWSRHIWRYRSFGIAAILTACVCVSTASVSTKTLLASAPVLPVLFVQLLASTIVIWTTATMTGRVPKGRRALKLALPGLLQPGLVYIFAFLGLAITPVSLEGLLFAFESAIVALLAWPLLRERPSAKVSVSILVGTAGVVLLSWPQSEGFGASGLETPVLGVVLILVGVVCASLDTIASRALAIDADPLTMTAAGHVAGLTLVTAALILTGPQNWNFLSNPSAVALVVVSGILLHGLATILFNAALAQISASQAAALFPSISLFTAVGGYAVLGEQLRLLQLIGGAMVIGSSLLIAWRRGTDP